MFWRLGSFKLTGQSSIENLLEQAPNITLEQVLDEEELLQECKSQNVRLLEYLQNLDVLRGLLGYLIHDLNDPLRLKYAHVAFEVLSCEIGSIGETIMENKALLYEFWEFLEQPAPLNPLQASYFVRVNEQFLEKKPDDMVTLIQSIPDVISKLLQHIETSTIADLLFKMISVEQSRSSLRMVDWLQSESLIPFLLSKIDPHVEPSTQSAIADVLKTIIVIGTSPSGQNVGSNVLLQELASKESMEVLVSYMLHSDAPFVTSSLVNGASIVIELIRKNHRDDDHPSFLDSSLTENVPLTRDPIDLSAMLKIFASHIFDFQAIIVKITKDEINTSFGKMKPLGIERFRICELYAELLYCSNVVLFNGSIKEPGILKKSDFCDKIKKLQDTQTIKNQDAFSNLELCDIYNNEHISSWDDLTFKYMDSYETFEHHQDFYLNKNNDINNIFKEQTTEIKSSALDDPFKHCSQGSISEIPDIDTTSKYHLNVNVSDSSHENLKLKGYINNFENSYKILNPSLKTNLTDEKYYVHTNLDTVIQDDTDSLFELEVGDYLKMQFIEHKVLSTMLDMFFMFPLNNFLHNVVYDLVQQVLNSPINKRYNNALIINMFSEGKICEKIIQGQKENDNAVSELSGIRLGYMGHLTLVAEEIIKFTERYPLETLSPIIIEKISSVEWIDYVEHSLAETRARNNSILGGVRPHHLSLRSVIGFDNHGLQDFTSDTVNIDYDDDDDLNRRIHLFGIEDNNNKGVIVDMDDDGNFGHNQFLTYINQQITGDFSNKHEDSDEDEKEDLCWMEENENFKQSEMLKDLNESQYQELTDEDDINGSLNNIFEEELYDYKENYIDKNISVRDFLIHDNNKEKSYDDYDDFDDESDLNPDNGIQRWNYELFNTMCSQEQEIQEDVENSMIRYNDEYCNNPDKISEF